MRADAKEVLARRLSRSEEVFIVRKFQDQPVVEQK